MYHIGIDIGSIYTKYCIMNEKYDVLELFSERTPIRQKEYFDKKRSALYEKYPDARIVSCGYGRKNVNAIRNVSELIALAEGIRFYGAESGIVLDIGGQDTKVIFHEKGKLKNFFMNDKCAAGCGMFLTNTLNLLQTDFSSIATIAAEKPETRLSSMCAVFAQSEIVELLAADTPTERIIQLVLWQILSQAKMLLDKAGGAGITLSGGLTQIKCIAELAELVFGRECIVPPNAAFLSAIGCAVLGMRIKD